MKKSIGAISALVLLCTLFSAQAHENKAGQTPKLIPVPDGFQPEGVVLGQGATAYIGSLNSGSIYQVDLHSGEGSLLVTHSDNPAVGLAYDRRSRYLYSAGGPSGTVSVYDAIDGQHKTTYSIIPAGTGFINDGIVTREAAFFTDSFAPVIYRIPLGKNGRLPDSEEIETIVLSGDFEFVPGNFNANGIESVPDEDHLLLVNMAVGKLYKVHPETGHTDEVTIDNGNVMNGDGLLFYHDKLYVVQNFLNQVAELKLNDDASAAHITRILSDPEYRIPTTATAFKNTLYVINARFDTAPPPFFGNDPADPELTFNLVSKRLRH